jgi:DNA-binding NarL/FixJ family response regulator
VSPEVLIREAIRTALRTEGIAATSLSLPVGPAQLQEARRRLDRAGVRYGLLVVELGDAPQLAEAVAALSALPLTWLVLTTTPPGMAWGAAIDAGAAEVRPTSITLGELTRLLRDLAAGESVGIAEHDALVDAWRRSTAEERLPTQQLERLSPREMAILMELHDGHSVAEIAEQAGVSPDTVRTQVKSVLRKLQVTSQLQAVAKYRQATDWLRQ